MAPWATALDHSTTLSLLKYVTGRAHAALSPSGERGAQMYIEKRGAGWFGHFFKWRKLLVYLKKTALNHPAHLFSVPSYCMGASAIGFFGPLPNGHSWLVNGGNPHHLQVLGCSSKYRGGTNPAPATTPSPPNSKNDVDNKKQDGFEE